MNAIGNWLTALLLCVAAAGPVAAQDADSLYKDAQTYYEQYTWDRAIRLFEQFAQKYPGDPRAAEAEFKALEGRYRLRRVQDFKPAVEAFCDKRHRTVWAARGKALLARFLFEHDRWSNWERIGHLYAMALSEYRGSIGRRTMSAEERSRYVAMMFDAVDYHTEWYTNVSRDKALQYLQTLLRMEAGDEVTAKAWLKLGLLYRGRFGDTDKAVEAWDKVVRGFASTEVADDALYLLAETDYSASRYVSARTRLLELRQRYPKSQHEARALELIKDIEAPRLNLEVSATHLPGGRIPTHVTGRNIKGATLTAYKVDPQFALDDGSWLHGGIDVLLKHASQTNTWHVDLADQGDYQYMEVKLDSPMRAAGLYVVTAVADGSAQLRSVKLVNVSSLVLVQQYAAGKLVSYVVDRTNRQPLSGVDLHIWRYGNTRPRDVGRATTDQDGLATLNVTSQANENNWQLAAIGRKGDQIVVQSDRLYAWWNEPGEQFNAYVYTDRPVYRPENKVNYRAVLRTDKEGRFSNLAGKPCVLTIRNPQGEEVHKNLLTTDEFGTVNGSFTLAKEPKLGLYTIVVEQGGRNNAGQFRVEEYRKPEFKVSVGRPMGEVRPGGAVAVPVTATYYFGAPVADAEVKYVIQKRPYYPSYWFAGDYDWLYSHWRRGGYPYYRYHRTTVREGTAKTDAKGQAVIEFPTVEDTNDYTYTIDVEVADVTRRVVDGGGSFTVTHKGFYLFARSKQGLYKPDATVDLTVRAQNADQQPVEAPVTATLYKLKWVPETRNAETNAVIRPAQWQRDVAIWPQPMSLRTDPNSGRKDLTFKAPGDGFYEVSFSAPDTFDKRAEVVAVTRFWVASDAYKGANYNHADLQIVTEKDLYQRGETARLLVTAPVTTGALLLTIGAEHIYSTKVIRFEQSTFVVELPISDNYSPNVYLSGVVVGVRQTFFAQKELMVPPTEKLLNLRVVSDQKEYKPRTKGKFTLEVTDEQGRPVSAQVSLGITDDSVYAIQEEIAQPIGVYFYGRRRGHGIRQAVSLESYGEYDEERSERNADKSTAATATRAAKRDGVPGAPMAGAAPPAPAPAMAKPVAGPDGPAGGGGGGGEEPIAIREFFPDTTLWQPTVTTGADGKATVTVDFPDSLTTWRTTARAVTKDTRVGQKVEEVITSKDLIVRLQAPRFFTQLDQSTVSVVVTNKTDRQQQVAIGLQVDGLQLAGSNRDSVVVAPRGQARVDRQVRATQAGKATIVVTARGPNDSDGVKLKFDVIPHGAEKFANKAGRIGADGRETFTLNLPAARRQEATRLKVSMQPTLVSALLDALPWLVEYPYGCVEQTTSKFLPAVMVARTLDYTGKPAAGGKPKQVPDWWKSRGLDELPDMVREGIKRLTGMQNSDGGFGWFSGMRSDVWMSAYVTYALIQARAADFAAPADVLEKATTFLLNNLHLLKSSHDSSAYVTWVLSEAVAAKVKQPNAEQQRNLEDAYQRVWANRDQLNDYTRALLILAMVNKGDKDKAKIAWENLQATRIETESGVHWGQNRWGWRWSEDQVETTAFATLAALAVEPNSELATKAVNWLTMNRTGNRWYNTKDTAAAIFALARYADVHQELKASYTLTLAVNGQTVKGWEVTPQNVLTLNGIVEVDPKLLRTGDNQIELRRTGQGSVYYSALLEYYTQEDPITAASSYLSASRKYYKVTEYTDPQDNTRKTKREELRSGDPIASGEQIEVEVTIDAENEFDYVCLADPKPAGCEPVDKTSGGTWGDAWLYRELRDKEVTFFADHLRQGKTTLSYRLRAETPGLFRALPHHGFSMYRADVRCLSDEATIQVTERPAAAQ